MMIFTRKYIFIIRGLILWHVTFFAFLMSKAEKVIKFLNQQKFNFKYVTLLQL